jgi:peptide-methionine (R)-S-oxide reductase
MTRRQILGSLAAGLAGVLGARKLWQTGTGGTAEAAAPVGEGIDRLELPDEKWRALLDEPAYAVLRQHATEPAGLSPLNAEKRPGHFLCAGCFLPLFRSEQKFESGTGWPSFFDSLPGRLGRQRDFKLVIPRTEYHCIRCSGHQGHVFEDGPPPTGLRYCNNGAALRFIADGEPLPALRV